VTGSWTGGFQVTVTVANNSSTTAIVGWSAYWTMPTGQSISSLWNGNLTTSGSKVTVSNLSYNGALAPGASTTFGFTATGPDTPVPTVTCTST
jgi:cellulase/cellobiase CelA1